MLLESFVTVMLKGAAGSAVDGNLRVSVLEFSAQEGYKKGQKAWESSLESLLGSVPFKLKMTTQYSQDHSDIHKPNSRRQMLIPRECLCCGERLPLPESGAPSDQGK